MSTHPRRHRPRLFHYFTSHPTDNKHPEEKVVKKILSTSSGALEFIVFSFWLCSLRQHEQKQQQHNENENGQNKPLPSSSSQVQSPGFALWHEQGKRKKLQKKVQSSKALELTHPLSLFVYFEQCFWCVVLVCCNPGFQSPSCTGHLPALSLLFHCSGNSNTKD